MENQKRHANLRKSIQQKITTINNCNKSQQNVSTIKSVLLRKQNQPNTYGCLSIMAMWLQSELGLYYYYDISMIFP